MSLPNAIKTLGSSLVSQAGTIVASGGSVVLETDGAPSVVLQVSGTWQLDLVCQVSMDNINWSNPLYMWEVDRFPAYHGHIQLGMNAISGAQSRNGQYRVKTDGMKYVRVFAQAAGGTPGTAAITITSSPVEVVNPPGGFHVLIMDAVDLTAARTTPVLPQPGPGWRWDVSNTFTNIVAGPMAGNTFTPDTSDTYAFTAFAQTQNYSSVYPGYATPSGHYPAESQANAANIAPANYIRWRWVCTTYPTSGVTTRWVNFFPPVGVGPFNYAPGVADQSSLSRTPGSISQGFNQWSGAQLLASDNTANSNGGKLRQLRCDTSQRLIVAVGTPDSLSGGIKRKARNVNATPVAISTFANGLMSAIITNTTAASAFVNFYDAAVGSVTVGTTVPDFEFEVPAGQTLVLPITAWFGTAITVASVTTDNGTTGSAAGVHVHCVSSS